MSVQEFRRNGYAVFPEAIDEGELGLLRACCDRLLEEPIDDGADGRHRIGRGEARRFLAHRHADFPDLEAFVLGPKMAAIGQKCLGSECLLFNEQFVVKGARHGASFAWHQDGAYVGFKHLPYLTVWIALDDASEENGCVYLLPRDLDEAPDLDSHEWNEDARELNGYSGSDPGRPMTCAAGTIVAFSSLTLHRSGDNVTDRPRRAYICQYSVEPLRDPQTGALKQFAKPLAIAA